MTDPSTGDTYDVFLSHSHLDTEWVEDLACRLEDEHQLRAWFDRWVLIPGESWQQPMAVGIEQARSCAVLLGHETPRGWFEKEMQKALNRQARDRGFRVIPVLLPGADSTLRETLEGSFVELNTWIDFDGAAEPDHALHLLVCGIKGVPPGRWQRRDGSGNLDASTVAMLRHLQALREDGLVDDTVARDYQRKILDQLLRIP